MRFAASRAAFERRMGMVTRLPVISPAAADLIPPSHKLFRLLPVTFRNKENAPPGKRWSVVVILGVPD